MLAKLPAVVTDEPNHCVVRALELVQLVEQHADQEVRVADARVVCAAAFFELGQKTQRERLHLQALRNDRVTFGGGTQDGSAQPRPAPAGWLPFMSGTECSGNGIGTVSLNAQSSVPAATAAFTASECNESRLSS